MAQSRSGEALGASYRLVELIGSGAAGEVWRATVAPHDDQVAAKLLKPEHAADPGLVERFVRERSVLVSLRHPGIVRVRDLVVEGDRLAIVMDLVPGGSLRDVLAERGTLPPADATTLVAEVLDALGAAHARQVSHRDVKPDNVLLAEPWRPGLRGAVRVGDFGIASVVGERERTTTGLLGTPWYMAPELISHGRSGPEADVYAAGVVLYELLAGRTPFAGPGTDFTVAYRHVTSVPPVLDVPGPLWSAVSAMLEKDPAARPTAAEAAARLRRLAPALEAVPALAPAAGPGDFAEVERPATVVRGAAAAAAPPPPTDGDGDGVPEPLPDLGSDGSRTVVRPMPRREVRPPTPVAATPERQGGRRPAWLTNRVAVLGAAGLVVTGLLVAGVVRFLPDAPADAGSTPVAAEAHQQDAALPTGLTVSRDAAYDPDQGRVRLTLTYAAQAAPLSGQLLEVVPGLAEGDACPPVTWSSVTASRNVASVTGLTADCAWSLDDVEVPAGGQLVVEATLPLELADAPALDEWLEGAAAATTEAVGDDQVTSTAYPVQRLRDVEVRTPPRTVSQTALPVVLVPVWPNGPDELSPLYSSPATGSPSQLLQDVAGGEAGVRFVDGCSGALAVSSDGLVVTALSVAPACVLRATVGAFTALESSPFSITTRD